MTDEEEEFTNIGGEYGKYENFRHCASHPQLEIRIGILESKVEGLRGDIKDVRCDLVSVVHELKNVRQQNIGLLDLINTSIESNKELTDTIIKVEQKHGERYEELQKRHSWEFMRIIGVLILIIGGIALGRAMDVLSILGLS